MVLAYVSVLVNKRFKLISADARKKTCSTLLGNTYVWNTIAVLLRLWNYYSVLWNNKKYIMERVFMQFPAINDYYVLYSRQ